MSATGTIVTESTQSEKQCRKCGQIKDINQFVRDSTRDGRSNRCKPCEKEYRLMRKEKTIQSRSTSSTIAEKKCSGCSEVKPLNDFYSDPNKPDGRRASCKDCTKKNRPKYAKNGQPYSTPYTSERSLRARERRLKRLFGLTTEQYNTMLAAQNGMCAICGNDTNTACNQWGVKRLAVDHCHETGKIRGLLCTHCNVGLGYFNDDVELMKLAIAYVEYHRSLHSIKETEQC